MTNRLGCPGRGQRLAAVPSGLDGADIVGPVRLDEGQDGGDVVLGQDLAKGGEDCRVDDSHRWYEKGGGDKEDTEADEQKGKKNLMLHLRC